MRLSPVLADHISVSEWMFDNTVDVQVKEMNKE